MSKTKHDFSLKISRLPKEELNHKKFSKIAKMPTSVDLRPHCPPVWDQGQLGCCTGFGISFVYSYNNGNIFDPSQLFLYYCERVMEHDVSSDAGANISDGIKCLQKNGICSEASWPYDISKFKTKPPATAFTEALKHTAIKVANIEQTLDAMKTALANNYPIVLGISVYSSFESDEVAATGVVPMPTSSDTLLGGHCVACVGYLDSTKQFIMRNSWSKNWGGKMQGYFLIPYDYLLDPSLCSDMWVVEKELNKLSHKS